MSNINNPLSRRTFLKTSLIGAAGITVLPANAFFKKKESINLGFIGLGRQVNYLQGSFLKIDGVKVVAGADVYAIKRERWPFLYMDFVYAHFLLDY